MGTCGMLLVRKDPIGCIIHDTRQQQQYMSLFICTVFMLSCDAGLVSLVKVGCSNNHCSLLSDSGHSRLRVLGTVAVIRSEKFRVYSTETLGRIQLLF